MTTTRTERWHEHYEALRQFVNRTGTSTVPTTLVETYNGRKIALGAWVAYNRQRKRAGTLPADRVQALESFAGWKWDKQQPGRRYDKSRDTAILESYKNGRSARDLAREFNLSRQRVHQIVRKINRVS